MTADLAIETARKENVLLLPNATLITQRHGPAVQVPVTAAAAGQPTCRRRRSNRAERRLAY